MKYTSKELEEFHKQTLRELEEKLKENESRFHHTLDTNNSTTQLSEDAYIEKMKRDYLDYMRLRKLGKKHFEYSPEFKF